MTNTNWPILSSFQSVTGWIRLRPPALKEPEAGEDLTVSPSVYGKSMAIGFWNRPDRCLNLSSVHFVEIVWYKPSPSPPSFFFFERESTYINSTLISTHTHTHILTNTRRQHTGCCQKVKRPGTLVKFLLLIYYLTARKYNLVEHLVFIITASEHTDVT